MNQRYGVRSVVPDFAMQARAIENMPKALAKMGWDGLRKGQEEVCFQVMACRDVLAILSTSVGKTGTYVIPTLAMGLKTIVFSPLQSLIIDQSQALQRKGIKAAGVTASHSDAINAQALRDWESGELAIMLVSPERVKNERWLAAMNLVKPDMIALDECGSGDTEVLTDRGFVRLDRLDKSEKVAQYRSEDSRISFVKPTRWIKKKPTTPLMSLRGKSHGSSIDFHLTAGHNMLFESNKPWGNGDTEVIKKKLDSMSLSHYNYFKVGGYTTGIDKELTDEDRLMIAAQADGTIVNNHKIHFTIKKGRKKERLLNLLNALDVEFTEVQRNGQPDVSIFKFSRELPSGKYITKDLGDTFNLTDLHSDKCKSIIDEMVEWDDHRNAGSDHSYLYANCDEASVDFYQAVALMCNYRTHVTRVEDNRSDNYSNVYRLYINKNKDRMCANNFEKVELDEQPDYVYCVEVPDGNIIIRRNGRVMVTGNCHTLSDWSDNFRDSYKYAGDWVARVQPRIVLALTATATPEIEADVRRVLGIDNAERVLYRPRRKNLNLFSKRAFFNDKSNKNLHPEEGDMDEHEFLEFVASKVEEFPGESVIVYCNTTEVVEKTAEKLNRSYIPGKATYFHGKVPPNQKRKNQDAWMNSEIPCIVCTNAFGMGIDKGNVRVVIHRDMPGTPEEIDQQNGRAGRDHGESYCYMFYSKSAIKTRKFFLRTSFPTEDAVRKVYNVMKGIAQRSPKGLIYEKNDVICKKAGVDIFSMQAVMTYLHGEKMICEDKDALGPPRVRLQESYTTLKPIYSKILNAIISLGVDKPDNWIEFDMESVAEELFKKPGTLRNNLKTMHDEKVLEFCPPPPRPPRRVCGEFDGPNMDHSKIDYKAQKAKEKLDDVITYCHTEDSLKHNFLESCLIT